MSEIVFAIPGDLSTPTGGYRYDRRVMEELRSLGWQVKHLELAGDFPSPSDESLADTAQKLAALGKNTLVVVDGLALGAMPRETLEALQAPLVALVHHPLAFETGLSTDRIDYLHRHIEAVKAAMEAGADIGGYFHWTLLDNWEWAEGYRSKFGLVAHDRATGARTKKASYSWFSALAQSGALP